MSTPAAFIDTMTLADARALLRTLVDDGHECPVCKQHAKVYRRTIHASMASALLVVWRENGTDWAYVPDTLTHRQNADFAKLAHWGLIEAEEGERADGSKRTGRWRVTTTGASWACGFVSVPKYAHVYAGRKLKLSGPEFTRADALGDTFDFAALMGTRAAPAQPEPQPEPEPLFEPPDPTPPFDADHL